MSWALPFKRGWYWASNETGAIPSGILGKTFLDPTDGNDFPVSACLIAAIAHGVPEHG